MLETTLNLLLLLKLMCKRAEGRRTCSFILSYLFETLIQFPIEELYHLSICPFCHAIRRSWIFIFYTQHDVDEPDVGAGRGRRWGLAGWWREYRRGSKRSQYYVNIKLLSFIFFLFSIPRYPSPHPSQHASQASLKMFPLITISSYFMCASFRFRYHSVTVRGERIAEDAGI